MTPERRYERLAFCVKRRMAELHLKQKDLCRETGMSNEFIRKMRAGLGVPSGEKLERLAAALQLDPEYLRTLLLQDAGGGDVARNMTVQYASLRPLEEVWDQLTARQQQDLAKFASYLARANRQSSNPRRVLKTEEKK